MTDARNELVRLAQEGPSHAATFTYDEVRPLPIFTSRTVVWTFKGDCSWYVRYLHWCAGCKFDPCGLGWALPYGNTQSLTATGTEIPVAKVIPGDTVVYDAFGPLSNQHTAVIVGVGDPRGPLTSSFGQQGCPCLVYVSQDGRTPTYLRFDLTAITIPDPPLVVDSVAWHLGAAARPHGPTPTLQPGQPCPYEWVVYLRRLLNTAGIMPPLFAPLGGYGHFTRNHVIRYKVREGLVRDPIVAAETWLHLGVR
jgi:hypothetical protein